MITAQRGIILPMAIPTTSQIIRAHTVTVGVRSHFRLYNRHLQRVIEYSGPAHACPQADGKPFYRIAVPADNREHKISPTYQNNIWAVRDYSYSVGTLSFTTIAGEREKTSINSIDRALTLQLNRERGANFQLPR